VEELKNILIKNKMEKNTTTIIIIVLIAAVAIFAFTQKGCSIDDLFNNTDTYSAGGNSNGGDNGNDGTDSGDGTDGINPRCIDHDGSNIWLASYVDDTVLQVSYPDVCKNEPFKRYLYEKVCVDGLPAQVEVDCWAQGGAVCNTGACVKPQCQNILNPNSQDDCNIGLCSDPVNTYCKYVPPTTMTDSRCTCTPDPATIDTCDEACMFIEFKSDGYCADPLQKVPCGTNTHYINYDKFCPLQNNFRMACCCY
jgi:hypothetical protein